MPASGPDDSCQCARLGWVVDSSQDARFLRVPILVLLR